MLESPHSRRSFLKTTAIAGLGLAPSAVLAGGATAGRSRLTTLYEWPDPPSAATLNGAPAIGIEAAHGSEPRV